MRAIVIKRFGVLELVELPRPRPSAGEVLVRVRAAGVNPGERSISAGKIPELGKPPLRLGSDFSGVVEEVGAGVATFRPGDEVYGLVMLGAYADYVTIDAGDLAAKPATLDHVHAAALPLAALTAWQAIVELGDVQPAQRVLVHAAAGGVGHIALQLARARGAEVIGTARADKHGYLRALGADRLIDYTSVDFSTVARDVDVVVDLVGGEYGPRSLESLKPGGLLLAAALDPGVSAEQAQAAGRRFARIAARPSAATLARVAELADAGRLRVSVQRTFPLESVDEAHRLLGEGRVQGKLVLLL